MRQALKQKSWQVDFVPAGQACYASRPSAAHAGMAEGSAPFTRSMELTHSLKLHPEGEGATPSLKKPVLSEHYEEIVFSEPTDVLHRAHPPAARCTALRHADCALRPIWDDARRRPRAELLANHKPRPAPASDITQWLGSHNDREELWHIQNARRIVADHTAQLQQALNVLG